MKIKSINQNEKLWQELIDYANNCNREAGPILAQKMKENNFLERERIFVATENDNIIGYCTFTKEDGIPNCNYSPFIGFIFVDENYRGKRVSEKMINAVEEYAKTLNFHKLCIVSDHKGLYEKYGFEKCDEKADELGRVETIFFRKIKYNMISRTRFDGNIYNCHKNIGIKQIYARIYIKSIEKIIIVSKDGVNWQMPGGKPEKGETNFETLQREIYEETSINLTKNCNPIPFGYYHIEENGTEYLQLRYFIKLDNINSEYLKPTENSSPDSIKFTKLVTIDEILTIIPRLQNSGEFNSFNKIIRNT